jgi:WhiB family redox-sensing transcriptional regulator
MDGAACRDMPVEQFYPSRGTRGIWAVEAACEVCRGCPVQAECLLDALRRGERYGVWGGMQERTRRRVRVRWLRELRRLTRSAG